MKLKNFFTSKFKSWLVAGILVILPLTITFYIIAFIFTFFDNLFLTSYFQGSFITKIPGGGVILSLFVILFTGFVATNFFGKFFIEMWEKVLDKIPIVRTIYSTVKQVSQMIFKEQSNAFREVILFEYPRKGLWALAFVTSRNKGEIQNKITEENVLCLFLPTTPNPTSGFLLFVPETDVIKLNMKTDEAMKLIISAGVIDKEEIVDKYAIGDLKDTSETTK